MEFKNIIFDIDGTIVDTFYASKVSLRKAVKEMYNRDLTEAELILHFGIPTDDYFKQIGIEDYQAVSELWSKYYTEYQNKIYDGIKDLIVNLHSNNINLSIVTSRSKIDGIKELEDADLIKYFNLIVLAEDTKRRKPYPDPILYVIDKLNLNKDETVYIGDTEYDSLASYGSGIKFGLALWGSLHSDIRADYKLKDPKEILSLIKKES